jgi:hypothetical protein
MRERQKSMGTGSPFTHTYLLSVFNWPLAPHESRALEAAGRLVQGANSLRFNDLRRLRADCQCERSPLSRANVSRARSTPSTRSPGPTSPRSAPRHIGRQPRLNGRQPRSISCHLRWLGRQTLLNRAMFRYSSKQRANFERDFPKLFIQGLNQPIAAFKWPTAALNRPKNVATRV